MQDVASPEISNPSQGVLNIPIVIKCNRNIGDATIQRSQERADLAGRLEAALPAHKAEPFSNLSRLSCSPGQVSVLRIVLQNRYPGSLKLSQPRILCWADKLDHIKARTSGCGTEFQQVQLAHHSPADRNGSPSPIPSLHLRLR